MSGAAENKNKETMMKQQPITAESSLLQVLCGRQTYSSAAVIELYNMPLVEQLFDWLFSSVLPILRCLFLRATP